MQDEDNASLPLEEDNVREETQAEEQNDQQAGASDPYAAEDEEAAEQPHINAESANIDSTINKIAGRGNTANQANVINNVVNIINHHIDGEANLNEFVRSFARAVTHSHVSDLEDDVADIINPKEAGGKQTPLDEKIIENIELNASDMAFVSPAQNKEREEPQSVPSNDEEISIWYHQQLNERERCFVQASAVLHGCPLRAIEEATKELYTAYSEQQKTLQSRPDTAPDPQLLPPDETPSAPEQTPGLLAWAYQLGQQHERIQNQQPTNRDADIVTPPADQTIDVYQLLRKTYTYTLRVNGAIRLFWQDTNQNGYSPFCIELLRFLAQETTLQDMFTTEETEEQKFLDIVKQWPAKYQGERSWRSAGALGIIWWHLNDRNLLGRQADRWAKSLQRQDWEHAAALLDGAYQVEQSTLASGGDKPMTSSILQLLDKWIAITHKYTVKRGEGYAAARAYTLIGRRAPDVALKGLEHLLLFPSSLQNTNSDTSNYLEDLFIFGVLKYVDIAKAGHVRKILAYLARSAAQHMQQRASLRRKSRDSDSAQHSTTALHLVLTAFFLVASCSLSTTDAMISVTYPTSGHLPDQPRYPNTSGKDLLLMGILLEQEQRWRDQMAILLAATIMEKNYSTVFFLMARWGELVLNNQDETELEDAYVRFLIQVGKQVFDWSSEQGSTRFVELGTYRRKLTLWRTDRRSPHAHFKQIAQKVLQQLPQKVSQQQRDTMKQL